MSGHNKWSKIKHNKGSADAKKGTLFTKLGHAITIAAREGGGDSETNFNLKLAIDRAKKINLPKENIERAIKRGTGELAGEKIEEVVYEGFGPQGTAIIVEALTDNKNRTVSSLRKIFSENGGSLGEQNSVQWMFEKKGIIKIVRQEDKNLEEIGLKAIDLGAEDIKIEEQGLTIFCKLENFEKVKKSLESQNIELDQSEIGWIAKDPLNADPNLEKKLEKLFNDLDNNPDINNYYSNID